MSGKDAIDAFSIAARIGLREFSDRRLPLLLHAERAAVHERLSDDLVRL